MRNLAGRLRALLRGDHDDTVRCAGTVDGGCRSILQDGEALDVLRVDGGERVAHTADAVVRHGQAVDDDQRIVRRVDGRTAADTDRRARTRHTGTGGDDHAGALAAQQVGGRRDDTLVDFVSPDRRNGTGEVALLDGTITDDHHFVEEVLVVFHHHVRGLAGLDDDGLVAQEADLEKRGGRGDVEGPVTVNSRLHAIAGTLLDNSSPDHRNAVLVDDHTLRGILGEGGHGRQCQDREQSKNLLHRNCFR